MLCYDMLCYVVLCCVMSSHVMSCHFMLHFVILSYSISTCPALSSMLTFSQNFYVNFLAFPYYYFLNIFVHLLRSGTSTHSRIRKSVQKKSVHTVFDLFYEKKSDDILSATIHF
jgi:hypothetical protein